MEHKTSDVKERLLIRFKKGNIEDKNDILNITINRYEFLFRIEQNL